MQLRENTKQKFEMRRKIGLEIFVLARLKVAWFLKTSVIFVLYRLNSLRTIGFCDDGCGICTSKFLNSLTDKKNICSEQCAGVRKILQFSHAMRPKDNLFMKWWKRRDVRRVTYAKFIVIAHRVDRELPFN